MNIKYIKKKLRITLLYFISMFKDKAFLVKTFSIAIPVAFQSILNLLTNLADTIMIGRLGEVPIAAVGLANKIFFIYTLLVFGISSGFGILAAQYFGNNDIKSIRKVLGLSLSIALVASLIFTGATIFCPQVLMKIFTNSNETIILGMAYLSIVGISYPFTAVSNIYISAIRAMGEVKIPIITSFITISINICLNYILIFGKFGLPSLGVVGTAIATVIARIIEICLILSILRIRKHPLAYEFKQIFSFSPNISLQFIKTSLPVILNELFWGIGVSLYSVAYGRMGNKAVASITIATSLQDIMQVTIFGMASATVVILGFELGSGKLYKAKKYATYMHFLTFMVAIFISTTTLAIREFFISFYQVSPEVYKNIKLCLLVFALYFPFKAISSLHIVGILRSGGDTVLCFLIDLSSVWLVAVPLAFLSALVWKFPVYIVYAFISLESVYKLIIGYIRYKQYKWLKNLNLELNRT